MDDLHLNYYRKLFCTWTQAASSVPASADLSGIVAAMNADATPFRWDVVHKCPANDLPMAYRKLLCSAIAVVITANGIATPTYMTSEDYSGDIAAPIDELSNWASATKKAGYIILCKQNHDLFSAVKRAFTYPGIEYH